MSPFVENIDLSIRTLIRFNGLIRGGFLSAYGDKAFHDEAMNTGTIQ